MKISSIILISFFSILFLFSVTTYINYRQYQQVSENAERFDRSSTIVRHSNRFQRNFLNMVSGLKGYLLTNDGSLIQMFDSAYVENKQILAELNELVPPQSDQKIILDDVRELEKYWMEEFAQPMLEAKKNAGPSREDREEFLELYQKKIVNGLDKDVQRSLQSKFSDFSNYEYGFRASSQETLAASVQNTRKISIYLTAFAVILGSAIAIFIAQYISSRIVRMVRLANAIAHGDYAVSLPDKGKNELSQLAGALNEMAAILRSSIPLLKRQKEELDQFAHIISHDLKAPLRGIDNVIAWIEEDHSFALPPKVNEYLELIKGRITRAENLLKAILSYARAGREDRKLEVVDLRVMLEEIRGDISNHKNIIYHIQPGMPTLYTERIPLQQVFTNLIVNAFKYHNKDEGMVKVYYQPEENYYTFFVEDDGPGINEAYHDRIFIIFQTLQERDVLESVGIGLAIVKKILDERGQTIRVSSEPGKGTVFSFTWPKTKPV
ncbi:MAG TPA: ATP-binding protein [Ohtaekwangia sp.]|jgi:signal transduction histidine kinase